MEFKLPDKLTVLEIHSIVIEGFGGLNGVPHSEYIDSTLGRPQHYMAYAKNCDIHLVAALILHGFTKNHAFADGNKRTALLTTLFTYNKNGVKLDYSLSLNKRFERLVLDIAQDKVLDIKIIRQRLRILIHAFQK